MLINNSYFTEVRDKGIPKFIPYSREYKEWWKREIHRCKYGLHIGGKYMTGRMYFYVNYWTLETNYDGGKRKSRAFPTIRDIDWDLFETLERCKGWSGFDDENKPVYNNDAIGMILITGRDSGKSSFGSGNVGYEYSLFADNEIVVSAGDMKFITPTMAKVRVGLDNIPGEINYMGKIYPSPLTHRRIREQWDKEIRSGYKDNETGVTKGYNSRILVRTFASDNLACNGLRPSFHIMEEVGAFPNLLEAYNSSIPCWKSGNRQFGVPLLIGTGGEMDRGSIAARKMFYEPETFGLMGFDDRWDNTGNKVGYFIPAYMGMYQFKNENGDTDIELGIKTLEERREKKKKDKISYEQELQYYPFTPKEAFLITTGNIFPRALLEEQLAFLTSSKTYENLGQKGVLKWDREGSLKWEPSDSIYEVDFPHDAGKSRLEGCITIYEHPQFDENGRIPFGLYIAGCDPIDQDGSTTDSLGSIFIYKRFWNIDRIYDTIVAEFTGRPNNANDFYETVRKILTYYNAKCLYENNLKGLFIYAEQKGFLHLLAEQPSILKDITPNSKVQRGYGLHMDKNIKAYAINRINEYLRTEYEPGKFNTHKIYSINLIKELLYFNNEQGNYDRVCALGFTLIYNEAVYKNNVEENTKKEQELTFDKWFNMHGFNKKII